MWRLKVKMATSPFKKDLKDWQPDGPFLVKDENANILSSLDENDSAKLCCSESVGSSSDSLQCSESMFSSASDDDMARITLLHQGSNRGCPSNASDTTDHQRKLSMEDAVQEGNRVAFFQSALWEHQHLNSASFNLADNFIDYSGQHCKGQGGLPNMYNHSVISSKVGVVRESNGYGPVKFQPVSSAGLVPYWNQESMPKQQQMSFGSLDSNLDLRRSRARTMNNLDLLKYECKSTVPYSLKPNTQLLASSYGSYKNMNLKQGSELGAVSYDSNVRHGKCNSSDVNDKEGGRFGQLHSPSTVKSQNQIPALSTWFCKPMVAATSADNQTDLETGTTIPPDLPNSLTSIGSIDSDFSLSDFDQYQKASTVNVSSKMHVNPATVSNPCQFQISGQMQDVSTVNSAMGNDTEMSPGRWALRRSLQEKEGVHLKGTGDVPGRLDNVSVQDLIKLAGDTEVQDLYEEMCHSEPGLDLADMDENTEEQTLKHVVEEITKLQKNVYPNFGTENPLDPVTTTQSTSDKPPGNSVAKISPSRLSPHTCLSRSDSTTSLTSSCVGNSSGNNVTLPWNTGGYNSTAALPKEGKDSRSGLSRPWENVEDISRHNLNEKGTDENGNTLESKAMQSLINTKNNVAMYTETAENMDDAEMKTDLTCGGIALLGKSVDISSASSPNTAKSDVNVSGQTAAVTSCDGAVHGRTAKTVPAKTAKTFPHNPADTILCKTADIDLGKTADVVLFNKLAKREPINDVVDRVGNDITAELSGGKKTITWKKTIKTGLQSEFAAVGKIAGIVPPTNLTNLNSRCGAACGVHDKNTVHTEPPLVAPGKTADIMNTVEIKHSDVIHGKTSDLKRCPTSATPVSDAGTFDAQIPEPSLLKSDSTDGSKLVMESRCENLGGSGVALVEDVLSMDTPCVDKNIGPGVAMPTGGRIAKDEKKPCEPDFSTSSGEKVELVVSTPSHDKLNEMVSSAGAWMFQSSLEDADGSLNSQVKVCDGPRNRETVNCEYGDKASKENVFPNVIADPCEDIFSGSDSKNLIDPVHPTGHTPRQGVVRKLELGPGPSKTAVNTMQNIVKFATNFPLDEDVGSELYKVGFAAQYSHDSPLASKVQNQETTVQSNGIDTHVTPTQSKIDLASGCSLHLAQQAIKQNYNQVALDHYAVLGKMSTSSIGNVGPKQSESFGTQKLDAKYQETSSAERLKLLQSCREYSFADNQKSQGDSSVESHLFQRSQLSYQDDSAVDNRKSQPSCMGSSSAKDQKLQVSCINVSGAAASRKVQNALPISRESNVEGLKSQSSNPELRSARDQKMIKPQPSYPESSSVQCRKLWKLLTSAEGSSSAESLKLQASQEESYSAESQKLQHSHPKNNSSEIRQSKSDQRRRGSANSRKSQPSYYDNSSTKSHNSLPYCQESNYAESPSGLGMSSSCIVLSDESEPPVDQTWRSSQADSLELSSNIYANFAACMQNQVLRKITPVRPVPVRYPGYPPYSGFEASYNMSPPYYPWCGLYQMNYFTQTEPLDLSVPKRHSRTRSEGRAGWSPKKKMKSSILLSHSDKKVSPCKRRSKRLHSIDGIGEEHSGVTVTSGKYTHNAGSKSDANTSDIEQPICYANKMNTIRTSLKPPKKRRYFDGDSTPVKEVAGAKNLQSSPLAPAETESPSVGIWKHPKKRRYVENEDDLNFTNFRGFEASKLEKRFEGENQKSNFVDDLDSINPEAQFKEPAADTDFSFEEKRWASMTSKFRRDDNSITHTAASTPGPQKTNLSLSSSSFGDKPQKVQPECTSSSNQGSRCMNSTPIKDVKQVDGLDLSYEESRWLAIEGGSRQGLAVSTVAAGEKLGRKKNVKQEPGGDFLYSRPSRNMFAIHSSMPGTIQSGLSNFIISSQSGINVCKMDNPASVDGLSKVKYPSWCKGIVSCDTSALAPYGEGNAGRDIDDSNVPWYRNETGDVVDALLPLLTCGICSQKMKGYFLMALHMMKIHEIHFIPQRLAGLCDICGNQYPGNGVLEKHIITVHTGLSPSGAQARNKGKFVRKKKGVRHRRKMKRSGKKKKQTEKKEENDGNDSNMEGQDVSWELWHRIKNEETGYEMIERSAGKNEKQEMTGQGPVHYSDGLKGQGHKLQVKKDAKFEAPSGQGSKGRMKKEEKLEEGSEGQIEEKLEEGCHSHDESTGEVTEQLVEQGGEVDARVSRSKKKKQAQKKLKVKETDEDHSCYEGQDGAEEENTIDNTRKKKAKTGKGGLRKKNYCSMREVGPFACEWEGCDMILKTRETLKVHIRRHTGEKPFGCHVCDYRGRQIASLHWHLSHVHGIGSKYQSSLRGKKRTPNDSNSTDGRKKIRRRSCPSDDKSKDRTKISRENTGRPTDDSRHKLAAGLNMEGDAPAAAGGKMKKKGKKSRKVELDPRHPLTMKIVETERPST